MVFNVASEKELQHILRAHPQTVVHFWARWCEPCAFLDTVLEAIVSDAPSLAVVRVEAEEVPELSERYDVSVVPYFAFFKDGQLVDTLEGASAADLSSKALALGARASTPSNGTPATDAAVAAIAPVTEAAPAVAGEERLRALVQRSPIMLFMKGSPDAPQCGFSAKVVAALRAVGADFDSFDILGDAGVRQGLKAYSNWPTFPQLYVAGELLGGCDIVLELAASGELAAELAAAGAPGDADRAAQLKALVSSSPVMLFMKGTPEEPRCGFSRKVVDALRSTGTAFGTFDILSDQDVRARLKEYSNWPTYPQLYVKGQLLGGCDIVLEMAADGSLKETITEMLA
ncbi:GRX4 [Auxenochlorella protothecoides x Auxenochlorella symbiontica]